MSIKIDMNAKKLRLLTAGKMCFENIEITNTGGGGDEVWEMLCREKFGTPDLSDTWWVMNDTLTETAVRFGSLAGTAENSAHTTYGFDSFDFEEVSGYAVFSFYYHSIDSPYEISDGFVYIPENELGFNSGWYFGNANDMTSYVPTTPPLIHITGGDDATNADLFGWMRENAKQLPLRDLTGSAWNITSLPTPPSSSFGLDMILGAVVGFGTVMTTSELVTDAGIRASSDSTVLSGKDTAGAYSGITLSENSIQFISGGAMTQSPAYPITVRITGGVDAASPDAIIWLTVNAELISGG